MSDLHHHGHSSTTVVDDREGPATAMIVLAILVIVGVLIWFFAFSGVVFDRDDGGTTNIDDRDTNIAPDTGGDTGDTSGDTEPQPAET